MRFFVKASWLKGAPADPSRTGTGATSAVGTSGCGLASGTSCGRRSAPLRSGWISRARDDASGLSYRGRFADLEHAAPAGVVVHDGRLLFPLDLPVAVERQAVVDAIVAQVRRVALRLG